MITSGAIGRVPGARILSTAMAFGPDVEPAMAFAEDAANGVTLPTIQDAHTIDCAITVLEPLEMAGALVTTQFPLVQVGDDPIRRTRRTPDHVLLQGRLASGAPVSIEVVGGRPIAAVPFRFEITGETGSLVLEGSAPRGFQSGRLRLLQDGREQACKDGALAGLPDAAINVAGPMRPCATTSPTTRSPCLASSTLRA